MNHVFFIHQNAECFIVVSQHIFWAWYCHFYIWKVWQYTTVKRWLRCPCRSRMPGFSAMQGLLRRPEKSQKAPAPDTGNLCGAFEPLGIFSKRSGTLPLFPKYWKLLPYLPDAQHFCRRLHLFGEWFKNRFYIPWVTQSDFTMWRKQHKSPYCHSSGTCQRKT